MANLKGRLEKLEMATPLASKNHCLVIHRAGVDCEQSRATAIAAYVEQNGHEPPPDCFIDIHLISPETNRSACACKADAGAV